MHHSFDISIAQKYGVNVAIFLNNIAFWINKNQANNKHFYEGRYWTYNSSEALSELFPYWSTDQMDRLIKKCRNYGLLLTDNFNETTYDRTRWYGLTDKALEMFNFTIPRKRGNYSAKSKIPSRENAEPIPDNKPDIKTDKREATRKKRVSFPSDFYPNPENQKLADEKAKNAGITFGQLFEKFKHLQNSKQKTSNDWQAEFALFCLNERPMYNIKSNSYKPKEETRSTVPWYKGVDPLHSQIN